MRETATDSTQLIAAIDRASKALRRIIGESAGIKRVHDLVRKVAPSDANVLISGESGTGKELVANWLHAASPRANRRSRWSHRSP